MEKSDSGIKAMNAIQSGDNQGWLAALNENIANFNEFTKNDNWCYYHWDTEDFLGLNGTSLADNCGASMWLIDGRKMLFLYVQTTNLSVKAGQALEIVQVAGYDSIPVAVSMSRFAVDGTATNATVELGADGKIRVTNNTSNDLNYGLTEISILGIG